MKYEYNMKFSRHAELVSASDNKTLNQVQGDELKNQQAGGPRREKSLKAGERKKLLLLSET